MAAIAQRIIGAQHKAEGDTGFLSDEEKEQLLKQLDETISQVADEQDVKVDELTNEVEELKQKVKLNESENI
jgi:predicted transposase YdaD